MEDLSEASGLNQRANVLDPETVSETDASHGKHQTDPIQGMSSKAAESGQGSSDLRNLGEKKNEKTEQIQIKKMASYRFARCRLKYMNVNKI